MPQRDHIPMLRVLAAPLTTLPLTYVRRSLGNAPQINSFGVSCLKNAKSTLLWRNSPRTWEQPYDMTHPSSRARPIEGWRTIWKKEGTNVWEERRAYRYSRVLRVDVLRLSDEVHSGRNGTKYDYDKMMYLIITFSAGFGAYWIFAQG